MLQIVIRRSRPIGCPPLTACKECYPSGEGVCARMINRRKMVASAAAAAAAQSLSAEPALAIDGGKPVREKPLSTSFFGTQYYGEEEQRELNDVVRTGRPFRWY